MPTKTVKWAIENKIPRHNLQTILINKNITKKDADNWLLHHNYRNDYYRVTKNERRYMQINPIKGAKYYSKILPNGIILVFQEY